MPMLNFLGNNHRSDLIINIFGHGDRNPLSVIIASTTTTKLLLWKSFRCIYGLIQLGKITHSCSSSVHSRVIYSFLIPYLIMEPVGGDCDDEIH